MSRQHLRAIPLLLASLIFGSIGMAEDSAVTMSFMGSSASSMRGTAELRELPSHFFQNNPDAKLRGSYRGIYPGIDMACIGDSYSTEYIFSLKPGANPDLISCFFRDSTLVSLLHSGSVQFRNRNIEIHVSKPIAYLQVNEGQESMRQLKSRATADGHVSVMADELVKETQQHLNGTTMNLVPGGGQPAGPMHDFFTSKLETSNEQLLYFLNDAEANQMNARGANMNFDKYGDIWINPAMKMARDEMFSVASSKLTYDPSKPVGHRYDHVRGGDDRPLYAQHPVMGLSWFGTLKYCNWLTLHSKRGTSELCYTEGTNTLDWAPATATNWANGSFTALERYEWLKLKGFRLPMTGTNSPLLEPNAFNEFYKAAAWNSFTNLAFGFGRDGFDGAAANFENTPFHTAAGTLPAGFFSKDNESLFKDLSPSANFYGIFDLSGNAAEWTTDANGSDIAAAGGSWSDPPLPINTCYFLPPYYTAKSVGMRAVSSYMPDFQIRIHLLVTFFLLEEGLPPLDMPEAIIAPYLPPAAPPPGAAIASDTHKGTSGSITGNQSPTDHITPGGVTYKEEPDAGPPPSVVGPITPTTPGNPGGPPPPFVAPKPAPPGPAGPPPNRTLTLRSVNPASGVTIIVTPDIVAALGTVTTPTTLTYTNGTGLTLTAPLTVGLNTFQSWQRDGVNFSTNRTVSFAISANHTLTATYNVPPPNRTLTVQSTNPGVGVTITATPDITLTAAVNTPDTLTYTNGTSLTLTAPPTFGLNTFQSWQRDGANFSTNQTIAFAMNADHTVTAIYSLPPGVDRTLTVQSSNPGAGVTVTATPDITLTAAVNTPGTLTYSNGVAVSVTAPPTAGINIFDRWQRGGVDVTSNQTYAFIMDTNYTVTAFYVPPPPNRILTVRSSNPGNGVTITATPDSTLTAAVSTPGTLTYSNGIPVSVFAPLMAGVNTFQRWQLNGVDVMTNQTYSLTMNADHTVAAFYVYIPGTIPDPDPSPSGI